MQFTTPWEAVKVLLLIAIAPLKANEKVDNLEFKMWLHLIPVRIARIPIIIRRSKNDEMNPLFGVFGRAF
jgi:hypothetical protein